MTGYDALIQAIARSPGLSAVLTLLLQSAFVMLTFLLVSTVFNKLTRFRAPLLIHHFWLFAFIVLLVLPALPLLTAILPTTLSGVALVTPLVEINVVAESVVSTREFGLPRVMVLVYGLVVCLLLLRLARSLYGLGKLSSTATPLTDIAVRAELKRLIQQLNIQKDISVRVSSSIDSPISFGMHRGVIVLPENYTQWNKSALTDVLMHELCHLRRHDWLTLILTHIVCAVYWANPLVWLARHRLLNVTEHRCDQDVVGHGRDPFIYAESLLGVANHCRQDRTGFRHPGLPAQPMFDRNTLKIRLNQVLKETTMKRSQIAQQSRKSFWGNSVFALFILSVLTFNPLLSAQDTQQPVARPIDKEMLPITDIMPYYPRKAADQNIEGHAIAQFTVDAQGNVVEDSITIIEATPSDIFNRSAIAAVRQFQFDPHLVNGQAVPVAEVEYQFNYRMKGE